MKFPLVWAIGIALLVICQCSGDVNAARNSVKRDRTYTLTLLPSYDKISRKLTRLIENFNVANLLDLILYIFQNCLSPVTTDDAMFHEKLRTLVLTYTKENEEQIKSTFNNLTAEPICQHQLFRDIHTFMWQGDSLGSLNDIVKFMANHGLDQIYTRIKGMYQSNNCPADLIDMIPDGPDDAPLHRTSSYPTRSSEILRNQILSNQSSPNSFPFLNSQITATCDIGQIIEKVLATGLLDLLSLIQAVIHEFVQQPSIHFLVGKIQEPAKGISYRELRLLPSVRKFHYILDQELKVTLEGMNLIEFLKNWIGIDLCSFNIMETIPSLLEAILWQNTDRIPPYTPDPPLPGYPKACLKP